MAGVRQARASVKVLPHCRCFLLICRQQRAVLKAVGRGTWSCSCSLVERGTGTVPDTAPLGKARSQLPSLSWGAAPRPTGPGQPDEPSAALCTSPWARPHSTSRELKILHQLRHHKAAECPSFPKVLKAPPSQVPPVAATGIFRRRHRLSFFQMQGSPACKRKSLGKHLNKTWAAGPLEP